LVRDSEEDWPDLVRDSEEDLPDLVRDSEEDLPDLVDDDQPDLVDQLRHPSSSSSSERIFSEMHVVMSQIISARTGSESAGEEDGRDEGLHDVLDWVAITRHRKRT
jgi:hypothetical protein